MTLSLSRITLREIRMPLREPFENLIGTDHRAPHPAADTGRP